MFLNVFEVIVLTIFHLYIQNVFLSIPFEFGKLSLSLADTDVVKCIVFTRPIHGQNTVPDTPVETISVVIAAHNEHQYIKLPGSKISLCLPQWPILEIHHKLLNVVELFVWSTKVFGDVWWFGSISKVNYLNTLISTKPIKDLVTRWHLGSKQKMCFFKKNENDGIKNLQNPEKQLYNRWPDGLATSPGESLRRDPTFVPRGELWIPSSRQHRRRSWWLGLKMLEPMGYMGFFQFGYVWLYVGLKCFF